MKKAVTLLSLLLSLGVWATQDTEAQTLHGFRLVKKENLDEFESTVRTYEHIKTGAKLMYISNTDDEKVFSITFKTHPTDETGIPHIIEHSVLCGSKKFPLKDPFVQLMKGSLKTFLNAMTFPDRTIYPVASRNDKDFVNLMHTYLDAVFYPKLLENDEILKQEGWHYEYDPKEKKLEHSGVVYGEMKGAYSSPERLIGRSVLSELFPNTAYSFDSGGNPETIPELTQEKFIAFHNKHYHPSNAIIYFYGNGDIKKHLAFVDKEYLSKFDKRPDSIQLPKRPEIDNLSFEKFYASNEEESQASFISYAFGINRPRDAKLFLALDVLSYYLGQSDAAPLKQLILDKKLAKDASVDAELGIAWPYFEISARNADGTKAKEFYKLVYESLISFANKGLDHELLEAALKKREFFYREFNTGSPVGLTMNYYVIQNWLYGDDPLSSLRFDKLFTELRNDIKTGYFEQLIKDIVQNNKHNVKMVLKPKKGLAEKEEQNYNEKMSKLLKSLSEEQVQQIISSTEKLKKNQKTPDSAEAIKTLPTLSKKDLNKKAEIFPRKEEKMSDVTFLTHELPTKGISYLSFYFDAQTLPQELVSYLPIFNHLMGSLDTKSHQYQELAKLIDLKSGGISFSIFKDPKYNDANSFHPRLMVSIKAFSTNYDEALKLLNEILFSTKWDNKKRIVELIQQNKASWDSSLSRDGMDFAMARLQAHYSKSGVYQELTSGISQYLFIKELEKNIDVNFNDFISKMEEIQKTVFNKKNLVVSLATEKRQLDQVKKLTLSEVNSLPNQSFPSQTYKLELLKGNEAIVVPGKVQYVVKGGKISQFKGDLNVINQNLRTDYLWNKVRVQNGAYGSFARFSSTGTFMLFSYRDPNLEKTLQIFDEMPDYVRKLEIPADDITRLMIGTISNLDRPLRPKEKADAATALYLTGKTNEWRQKEREQVLSITNKKMQSWGSVLKEGMKGKDFVVSGTRTKIDESKKLFSKIIDLTI